MTLLRGAYGFLLMLSVATAARAQLLSDHANFPILDEIQWGASIGDVRGACGRRQVSEISTDSSIVLREPMLGFAARTELQFDQHAKGLRHVQVRFIEPNQIVVDSTTNYFTRTLNHPPFRTVKEKSLLIVTIRMEIASWRLPSGLVNLVTARRGESLFDASLILLPPTHQQTPAGAK
jgi:hypothetical protein